MGPDRIKGIKSCKPNDYVKISKLVVAWDTEMCKKRMLCLQRHTEVHELEWMPQTGTGTTPVLKI